MKIDYEEVNKYNAKYILKNMTTNTEEWKKEYRKIIYKYNQNQDDVMGYVNTDLMNKLESYFSHLLQEREEKVREEILKMLWSIHENETDEEMKAWNRSLDLAIFRIKNPLTQKDTK